MESLKTPGTVAPPVTSVQAEDKQVELTTAVDIAEDMEITSQEMLEPSSSAVSRHRGVISAIAVKLSKVFDVLLHLFGRNQR